MQIIIINDRAMWSVHMRVYTQMQTRLGHPGQVVDCTRTKIELGRVHPHIHEYTNKALAME